MDIPDCYDPVYQAERREAEADKNSVRCEWCGDMISDDVFSWDGDNICESCCKKAISDNYNIFDIATAFNILVRRPWDI